MIIPLGKSLGLATGTVLAVGFASWNINRTIGGARVFASARQPAAAVPEPRKARAAVSPTVPTASARPAKPRMAAAPLEVAPDADPFAELVMPGQAPPPTVRPVAQGGPAFSPLQGGSAGPVVRVGPALPPVPGTSGSNAPDRGSRAPLLPDARTRPVQEEAMKAAAAPREPQVVGTMLGDVASAVFSLGEKVVIARVGDAIGDWKVLGISHSRVHLRHAVTGKDLTLRVSDAEAGSGGPADNSTSTPASPADLPLPHQP